MHVKEKYKQQWLHHFHFTEIDAFTEAGAFIQVNVGHHGRGSPRRENQPLVPLTSAEAPAQSKENLKSRALVLENEVSFLKSLMVSKEQTIHMLQERCTVVVDA